jgi:hypothetical protein
MCASDGQQFGAGNRRRGTSPQHAAEVMAATLRVLALAFIRAGIEGAVNGSRWAGRPSSYGL